MARNGLKFFDIHIEAASREEAVSRIVSWAAAKESRYVCLCNVHSVVTAHERADLKSALSRADLAVPDGMPLVWLMKKRGYRDQKRLPGAELMWRYCGRAEELGQSIYLYGSTPETLEKLALRLKEAFPRLVVAGAQSPPFRPLGTEEDARAVREMNESGAGAVFVGLGCPKQEIWMEEHRGQVRAVMIGVGAAFDFLAGTTRRAPEWIQEMGIEWLHRLLSEPRRLWRRYFETNLLFLKHLATGDMLEKAE